MNYKKHNVKSKFSPLEGAALMRADGDGCKTPEHGTPDPAQSCLGRPTEAEPALGARQRQDQASPNLFRMCHAGVGTDQGLTPALADCANEHTAVDLTPLPTQPISSPNGAVQTLNARALPLSPFEFGQVPDTDGSTRFAPQNPFEFQGFHPGTALLTADAVASAQVLCGLGPASGCSSPDDESPAVLPVAVPADLPNPSLGSFHCIDELEVRVGVCNCAK
jgi:hypothetical protein